VTASNTSFRLTVKLFFLFCFRKKKDTSVCNDIPEILDSMEAEIEKQLDSKAEKSNLTVAHVKSILKVCIYRCVVTRKRIEHCDRHRCFHVLLRYRYLSILSLLLTYYKVSEFIFCKGGANILKPFFRFIMNVLPLFSQ
jgi:hypothetical protein